MSGRLAEWPYILLVEDDEQVCDILGEFLQDSGYQVDVVTPPGVLDGPMISQFLLRDAPYGAQWIGARIRTALPANEFMTDYEEWLAIQNGAAPKRQIQFDATPRYIATGRDLAEYIHSGPALGWAAALILATPSGGTDQHYAGMYPPAQAVSHPSNPYRKS